MRRVYLLAVAALCITSPAFAHAMLERASPPVGSEAASPPHEIALTFTEGVEPLFSSIEVRNAEGTVVTTGKPHLAAGNPRRLAIDLPALRGGKYTVIWHVTSEDTHKTEGSFQFSVAR
jgi:methionine-rich copper-binding protein CopC